jgi:hypothetical protein
MDGLRVQREYFLAAAAHSDRDDDSVSFQPLKNGCELKARQTLPSASGARKVTQLKQIYKVFCTNSPMFRPGLEGKFSTLNASLT